MPRTNRAPIPLTVIDSDEDVADEIDTYIVVGESGEDVAFELCEDLEIALGVREVMIEDGFAVRLYQATEVEIIDEVQP